MYALNYSKKKTEIKFSFANLDMKSKERISTEPVTERKGLVKKYRGGWAGAFGNVVDKKHMAHPSLRQKND